MAAFGIVIPGRPVIVQFVADNAPQPTQWITEIETPRDVSDMAVFLSAPLGLPNVGIAVFWSAAPFENFQYLGAISDLKPSSILSTGWSLNPDVVQLPSLRILLALKSAEELAALIEVTPPLDLRKDYAKKIALNLFRFIESFSQVGANGLIQCPNNILDSWFLRFEEKFKKDPSFILRQE
eukprot:Platyproteum_vivax@DN6628_c0_g1_i1.p1